MADQMRRATGDDSWTFVMVSKMENGRKKIDAELLPIIADLQGQSIDWYYQPVDPYTAPPAASDAKGPLLNSGRSASITRLRPRLEVVPSQEASDNERPTKRAA